MDTIKIQECREQLLLKREELETRLRKIQGSKGRSEPLSADWQEQAQELENKEVVDALDNLEHDELEKIALAFRMMEGGNYGNCAICEEEIPLHRMKAVPWASQCVNCASKIN
jgi:RNA polymerase-binding transcription factor DksA